jgi:hypothetical protein
LSPALFDLRICIAAFINMGAIVLIPIAVIFADTFGAPSLYSTYDESKAAWANFGACFFGLVLCSLFGLPLVLLHKGAISGVRPSLKQHFLHIVETQRCVLFCLHATNMCMFSSAGAIRFVDCEHSDQFRHRGMVLDRTPQN